MEIHSSSVLRDIFFSKISEPSKTTLFVCSLLAVLGTCLIHFGIVGTIGTSFLTITIPIFLIGLGTLISLIPIVFSIKQMNLEKRRKELHDMTVESDKGFIGSIKNIQLNKYDSNGFNAFHHSIIEAKIRILKIIFKYNSNHQSILNSVTKCSNETALHLLAKGERSRFRYSNEEKEGIRVYFLTFFKNGGANFNLQDTQGNTPLHAAALKMQMLIRDANNLAKEVSLIENGSDSLEAQAFLDAMKDQFIFYILLEDLSDATIRNFAGKKAEDLLPDHLKELKEKTRSGIDSIPQIKQEAKKKKIGFKPFKPSKKNENPMKKKKEIQSVST